MSLTEYINHEKHELAVQASAILLMAKIKMMQYEFFHELDLQEVA